MRPCFDAKETAAKADSQSRMCGWKCVYKEEKRKKKRKRSERARVVFDGTMDG